MAQLFKVAFTLTLIKLVVKPSLTLAAYDPSFGLNDICEARCDHHRSRGWTGIFHFDCDEFSTEEEWDDCRNDCKECPKSVCNDAEDPNSYRCPETQITGECKEFCDRNRKNGTTGSYELNCRRTFENPDDVATCHRMCYACPSYVCDYLDAKTVYYCPGEGQVPPTTRKPRPPRTTITNASSTTTTTLTPTRGLPQIVQIETKDLSEKEQSPPMLPLPMNIAGRSLDFEQSNEPINVTEQDDQDNSVRSVSTNLTRETELTYQGPCKARCDKYRLGGPKEYDFKCDDLFETDEERDKCKNDCLTCPRKICPRKLNYVFLCPKSSDRVDQLDLGPLGLLFLITTVILSFVCVTIGAFYCCRRSGHGRLLSEDGTSGHQIEYLHQVPQQRQKQPGNRRAPMKIVSSDSII